MKIISVEELKEKLDNKEDFLLIDVREDYEYNEFNLGGQLIPLGSLMEKIDDLESYKEKQIVMMCRSGNRSSVGQHLLENAGFSDVYNLTGGILAWQEKFQS